MSLVLATLADSLGAYTFLESDDRSAILSLPVTTRHLPAKSHVTHCGDTGDNLSVLITGFAAGEKLGGHAARQIISLGLPGEILNLSSMFLKRADHEVRALTNVRVADVPREAFLSLIALRPAINRAVLLASFVESASYRQALLNLGQGNARQRIAHLYCEIAVRLTARGLARESSFELPMTQEHIGNYTGLTAVHVNRTIKKLEDEKLILRKGNLIVITNFDSLANIASFFPEYLCLDGGIR